jgi:3-phenylpropionate/trans-cinnamate dioxygenase ferredoxin reductase component
VNTVLIVGAGLAGARAAETLRAEGYDGRVVLVGEEPVAPYERPALSKEFLAWRKTADELLLRPHEYWDERAIELVLGRRIVAVDASRRTALAAAGELLSWDALILATGARPRRFPQPVPPGVHFLRTLADARALRDELVPGAHVFVVGGGFVGAEVASTAREAGVHVTLLEAAPVPFERALGATVGRLLAERYRAHGVDVRLKTGVAGFRAGADGRVRSILLTDGSELRCDAAVVGIGVEPADELLPRHHDGVPVRAAGDVAGGRGHWTSAAAEATNVARSLLGLEPLPAQPPFFWSDQFGLRLQLVGDTHGAQSVELDGGDAEFVARYRDADGRLLAALAANRPAEVAALRRELPLAA